MDRYLDTLKWQVRDGALDVREIDALHVDVVVARGQVRLDCVDLVVVVV